MEKSPIEESVASCGGVVRKEGYAQQLELAEKILMAQYAELRIAYQILPTTEEKYRNLYGHSPDLLRSISDDGIILDCNENYAKSLGYTKEEVTGSSIIHHAAERSEGDLMKGFEEWKKNGRVKNQTIWLRRKDGSEFPTLLSGTNLLDERGTIVGRVVSLRDMTEILDAREALQEEKAKRLMTIGQPSARLTHDIRNPLMAISNAA
ncbi:MAG: PAS domain S-box protein [Thaumarchaeota archaeon]|nr:PAS domain S-box protein [Nitrososphaerota archaeon]